MTCTSMFTAALFTITKTWQQPKCASTDKQTKNMWYTQKCTHTTEYPVQFNSVAQSCPTLCDPMNRSTPGLPVHHQLPVYSNSCPSSWWCHPTILSSVVPFSSCPPIPPSIRVFSNESSLCMRWPKYWSFSFRVSPSNEHPGLISFRMDWLNLLAVQGTLKSLLQHHSSKHQFFGTQLSPQSNSYIHTWQLEKP